MSDLMIKVSDVSKKYRLGQIGGTTLQHELQSWWAKRTGKEDPNSPLFRPADGRDRTFCALDGVSLEVHKGEAVGIIGRNGAGKSTLLKLLARVTAPTEGEIDLYGRVTSMLEIGAGFHGELTGLENIYINGAILGMSRAEVNAKLDQIIRFSELEKFIDTPVKRYSSGMYTKLGFSVAINLDSEIIIMDEVLAVGDIAFQNKCIEEMRKVSRQEGRTVLYVSHNMNQIRALCRRCIVLDHGKIVFDGDTEKAIEYYMENSLNENTRFDYTSYQRPDWLKDSRMRLLSACYSQKDNVIISDGEMMELTLKFRCFEDLSDIGLRIEIQSVEEQRLGTYVLYDICDACRGEIVELDLCVDVSGFRENTYKVIYCFFKRDQMGGNLNLDRVEGLSFTRANRRRTDELEWDFTEWGSLLLDGAAVTSVRKEAGVH